jgi:MscS family membrane protein
MEWLNVKYLQNSLQDWIITVVLILVAVIGARFVYWFFKRTVKKWAGKSETKLDDILVDMLEEPLSVSIVLFGSWAAISRLTFSVEFQSFLDRIFYIALIFIAAWLCVRLIDAVIQEYIVPLVSKSESDLDDQLLPLLRLGLKFAIWAIAIIIGTDHAGYDVGALIAGLGVGGLAFALAAQDTVSNLFGGFTIITDQPFKLNDRINVGGFDGVVKEIGIRSTRLQNLNGRVVVLPNSTFTGSPIENISSEPNRKVVLELGLTYDTTAEGIEQAMQILRDIITETEGAEETCSVGFNAFGDFALGVLFVYFIRKGSDILGTQTEINLKILQRFTHAGLEFAFPTQTLHLQKAE